MKRLLIAIALAVVVPACHRGPQADIIVGDPIPPAPPPPTTEVLIQATNFDAYDYVLKIEWQDPTGIWLEAYLFSVYGDPFIGPTIDYRILLANPELSYNILLYDPWGQLWDVYPLTIPAGDFVEVTFDIEDGYLYRTF